MSERFVLKKVLQDQSVIKCQESYSVSSVTSAGISNSTRKYEKVTAAVLVKESKNVNSIKKYVLH